MRLTNLVSWAWGKAPFPSPFRRQLVPMDRALRELGRTPLGPTYSAAKNRIAATLLMVIWPFKSVVMIVTYWRRYSSKAMKLGGPGRWSQLYDCTRLAWLQSLSPEVFYRMFLFLPEEQRKARHYLAPPNIVVRLFETINTESVAMTDDKFAVERRLAEHNLPVVQTVIRIREGAVEHVAGTDDASGHDLIVKPNLLWAGASVSLYTCAGGASWLAEEGQTMDLSSLATHIAAIHPTGEWLVQICARNHDDLRDLAAKAVSSVRLITGRWPNGEVEPIQGFLRIPARGEIADNYSLGGLAAALDFETGMLGKASAKGILSPRYEKLPDSKIRVAGRMVPYWHELIEIAKRAANTIPGIVFIGWDFAITNDGPLLIEANSCWDAVLQTLEPEPLGHTSFPDIVNAWLDHKQITRV